MTDTTAGSSAGPSATGPAESGSVAAHPGGSGSVAAPSAGSGPAAAGPAGSGSSAAAPLPAGPSGHSAEESSDIDSTGPRRVLIAVYAVFALAATSRAAVQLTTSYDEAPVAYLLSLFSGIVYIAATVGLILRGRGGRMLALVACSIELLGVLVVGTLSIFDSAAFPHDTVWSRFGSGYVFIPVILPILGLWFLLRGTARSTDSPVTTEVR